MTVTRIWVCLLALGLMLSLVVVAFAHDHNRPDLDNWFMGLHARNHAWCCDGPGKDAMHLTDADWTTQNTDGSHYRVKVPKTLADFEAARSGATVDTVWVDVPDDAVIDEPNKDGATVVWPSYGGWHGPDIRCFLAGAMG